MGKRDVIELGSRTDGESMRLMSGMMSALGRIMDIPSPILEGFQETVALPESFFRDYREAMGHYDGFIAHNLPHLEEKMGARVACRKGCNACCFDIPSGLRVMELVYLYDVLWGMGRKAREYFELMKLDSIRFQEILAPKIGDKQKISASSPEYREAQLEYLKEGRPCAFLGDDGGCDIYEHRPISCRMYFSLTDPAWCDPGSGKFELSVHPRMEPHKEIDEAMLAIDSRLGMDDVPTNLPMGLCVMGFYKLGVKPIKKC